MKKFFTRTKLIVIFLIAILLTSIVYRLKIIKIFTKFKIASRPEIESVNINFSKELIEPEEKKIINQTQVKEEKIVSVIQNQDIVLAVKQAVTEVGGIKLPKPQSIVLIKPNVNSNGKFPATTNPLVVKTLVIMAYQAGAKKVIVADSSGVGWPDTLKNMAKAGIKQVAEEAGAEVVDLEKKGWFKIKPNNSQYWPDGFLFSEIINEVDYIISVPIIKTHATTGITLSLKNSVGLLHRAERQKMHASKYIQEMIAEVNLAYQPDLIVFDGSKSFITQGPAVGKEVSGSYVIASQERLSSDIVAYQLLKKLGAKLEGEGLNHPMLSYALKIGLPYTKVEVLN